MDPDACLERWRAARKKHNRLESREALHDLRDWLRNGGFAPTVWISYYERKALGL